MRAFRLLFLALAGSLVSGCGERAQLPVSAGIGPDPVLPEPRSTLIPTVQIADVVGWRGDATPRAAAGLEVVAFARDLEHPRWLYVLPDGGVLVAESDTPPRPEASRGLRGWIASLLMGKAGSGGRSADRITLLRDRDADGVADERRVFLHGLKSPIGMALIGDTFFVANTDGVVRFPYAAGADRIEAEGVPVAALPAGDLNWHWTKSLTVGPDGEKLYAGVGSNSNVGENGMAVEEGRAAVWEIDPEAGTARMFARGLRNPVGIDVEPVSRRIWVAVNERDELGSDLVPDYMTALVEGGFYGWPYSYFGDHVDERVRPQRPDLVAEALVPDYALGAHTASLGLAFAEPHAPLAPLYAEGAFVGQHGSWNREPPSGYKVIFVPFAEGRPAGAPLDVLDGFLDEEGNARGRPVGVALDHRRGLLVADDVGDTVWRVRAAPHPGGRE
ncbi:MAG: sorbosone dehydrogenase family protein [Geminicoccaceae bacterium]|nr:sorbosone dehydrogenase family protein [Geminicoccaceae bacterium]